MFHWGLCIYCFYFSVTMPMHLDFNSCSNISMAAKWQHFLCDGLCITFRTHKSENACKISLGVSLGALRLTQLTERHDCFGESLK